MIRSRHWAQKDSNKEASLLKGMPLCLFLEGVCVLCGVWVSWRRSSLMTSPLFADGEDCWHALVEVCFAYCG